MNADENKYLLARSGPIWWTVPLASVQEVQMHAVETLIPVDSCWIRGVLLYHDQVIPSLDPQGLLQDTETDVRVYLICQMGAHLVAFVASELLEPISLEQQQLDQAEEQTMVPGCKIIDYEGHTLVLLQEQIVMEVSV